MFLKRCVLFEKFLTEYQKVYLEQNYVILLNLADNHYLQCCNESILLQYFQVLVHFHRFCLFFSVLPSNFIVSGVKSSRLYPFLILNVILFLILLTYICTDGSSIFCPCFSKMYSN